jgi:hypothetical protein
VFFVGHSTSKYVGRDNRGEGEGIRLGMASGILDQGGWYKGEHIIDTSSHDVAHSRCSLRQGGIVRGTDENEVGEGNANIAKRPSSPSKLDVADTTPIHAQGQHNGQGKGQLGGSGRRPVEPGLGMLADGLSYWLGEYLRVEPDIPRVATGVKNRVEQLKCYGNAVVPQQVYPILQAIADIERSMKCK